MPAVMGVETEYGVLAPLEPDLDPHRLATAVVEAWDGPATRTVRPLAARARARLPRMPCSASHAR